MPNLKINLLPTYLPTIVLLIIEVTHTNEPAAKETAFHEKQDEKIIFKESCFTFIKMSQIIFTEQNI